MSLFQILRSGQAAVITPCRWEVSQQQSQGIGTALPGCVALQGGIHSMQGSFGFFSVVTSHFVHIFTFLVI